MTDDRSKTDDAWVDALEGKPDEGSDESVQDARLIRAAIEAQDELTSERITDADVDAAKQRLIARLGGDDGSLGTSDDETSEQSTVVDLSSRRPARRSIWQQNPGMLLAASVAFVALVVMMLRNPDIPDGATVILSYGEIDIPRGGHTLVDYPVEDPETFGRELGARLVEREIPFVLTAESPDSPERTLSIQVDGLPNIDDVDDILYELGLSMPPTSVLILRLVPE